MKRFSASAGRLPACAPFLVSLFVAAPAIAATQTGFVLDLPAPPAASAPCSPAPLSSCAGDVYIPPLAASPPYVPTTTYAGSPAFSYAAYGNDFMASVGVTQAVVCDEVATAGPPPSPRTLLTMYHPNPDTGGVLLFDMTMPWIVDLSHLVYSDVTQPLVSATITNAGGASAPWQTTCYQVPVFGVPASPLLANSSVAGDRVFTNGFDPAGRAPQEPWVSASTIDAPNATQAAVPAAMPTAAGDLVYVVQVHNAAHADGWRVQMGYDNARFTYVAPGGGPHWCVLSSASPGAPSACSSAFGAYGNSTVYTVSVARDLPPAQASIWLLVDVPGISSAQLPAPSILDTAAVASIFPPMGAYPQRLDDKSVVLASDNVPVQLLARLVCANATPLSCTVYDVDGNALGSTSTACTSATTMMDGQLSIAANTCGSSVTMDPFSYIVDPNGGTTLPDGAVAVLKPGMSCSGSPILAAAPVVDYSQEATGAMAYSASALDITFSLVSSGSGFVPGTTQCTGTLTSPTATASLPVQVDVTVQP